MRQPDNPWKKVIDNRTSCDWMNNSEDNPYSAMQMIHEEHKSKVLNKMCSLGVPFIENRGQIYLLSLITIFLFSFLVSCSKETQTPTQPNPSVSASCSYGDTLEITIRIDRSWYEIPDSVFLTLKVKNISDDTIITEFPYCWPGYNFAIYDTFDNVIRMYLVGLAPQSWTLILFPDSSLIFPIAFWNMENDSAEVVSPGMYRAVGWLGSYFPFYDLRSLFLSFLLK